MCIRDRYFNAISSILVCVFGKNPINVNSSSSLETCESKVITEFAPGSDVIENPFWRSYFTITEPGSHINGVPASDTSAIFLPLLSVSKI